MKCQKYHLLCHSVQTYEQDVTNVLTVLDFVVKRALIDPSKVAVSFKISLLR